MRARYHGRLFNTLALLSIALVFVATTSRSAHAFVPTAYTSRADVPMRPWPSLQVSRIYTSTASSRRLAFRWDWDGDDIRWSTKLKRTIRRSLDFSRQPVRNSLILLNIVMYLYQVWVDVSWLRITYPNAWPHQGLAIVWDLLLGRTKPGPLTKDFMYASFLARQPHRFLTAGFLHGSIIHLLLNMDSMRRLPDWLETGLGAPLYLTTFVAAIVAGFVADLVTTLNHSTVVGASGGICGLYGLLYVCLVRMGSAQAAWRILTNMGVLLVAGALIPNISNAGHAGGFAMGIGIGLLLGPRYRKSYALRRKNSLQVDRYSRDYRAAMGFDKVSGDGIIPLTWVLVAVLGALSTQANMRSIPLVILQGLWKPGSVLQRL